MKVEIKKGNAKKKQSPRADLETRVSQLEKIVAEIKAQGGRP
jgi:uncharacterized protein YceH (UPF0502 family)